MKRKNKKISEEEMSLSNKEQELINLYNEEYEIVEDQDKYQSKTNEDEEEAFELSDINEDDEEDIEEFEEVEEKPKKEKKKKEKKAKIEEFVIIDDEEDEKATSKKKKEKNSTNTKINIIFSIVVVIIIAISLDIIAVSKYEKGPFLAIPLKTYKDGGTKEYYGLGYKVIKYNVVNGKKGMKLGSWFMKYNNEPVETNIIDLAIEFNNDETFSYKKYNKEYIKVSGTLESVSKKQNSITISYRDKEGNKYTFVMICNMLDKDAIKKVSTNEYITVTGTVYKYKFKTKKKPATLYLKDCYLQD